MVVPFGSLCTKIHVLLHQGSAATSGPAGYRMEGRSWVLLVPVKIHARHPTPPSHLRGHMIRPDEPIGSVLLRSADRNYHGGRACLESTPNRQQERTQQYILKQVTVRILHFGPLKTSSDTID